MHNSPHLVVSISGHGFGHVAQTAPVLNLLYERMPQLRLTIRSSAPLSHLRSRIHAPFEHLQSNGDIGMVMTSALDISVDDSRAAYRTFHDDWENKVSDEAHLLHELGADAVLSNVGYLALAGAQRAGIPNVALCSLNWADIYRHYCGDDAIAAQIHACYTCANAFLRATPGMAMSALPNLVPVAPIAVVGERKRAELNRYLQLAPSEKVVLVSMGGIAGNSPLQRWPRIDGVRWLVQDSWRMGHPDAVALESIPMEFSELLSCADVLMCKPGYGSFVEAACSSTPVLYVSRADWPETPVLVDWLQQHCLCREISREQFESGNFAEELTKVWHAPHPAPVIPGGADQVVDWLMRKLF